MISIALHIVLVVIATLWVVSTVTTVRKKPPNAFATGAGGGGGGERVATPKAKTKTSKSTAKNVVRISSKSAHARIALPELPDLNRVTQGVNATASKGFGGGGGGGLGMGVGVGRGGSNFVSRPAPDIKKAGKEVLGMNIIGENIAVYLDSSESMEPYLAGVEKQIKAQFPKADVFRYPGIGTYLTMGEFQSYPDERWRDQNVAAKLSPKGGAILANLRQKSYGPNVGGWVDVMLKHGDYDALILFSDFMDNIQQWSTSGGGRISYHMSAAGSAIKDTRSLEEKAWEARWLEQFTQSGGRNAPRLYLMSVKNCPHRIYLDCVKTSAGEFSIIEVPGVNPSRR